MDLEKCVVPPSIPTEYFSLSLSALQHPSSCEDGDGEDGRVILSAVCAGGARWDADGIRRRNRFGENCYSVIRVE